MVGFRSGEEGTRSQLLQKGLREPLLCSDCEHLINHDYEQPSVELWRRLAAHEDGIDSNWTHFTTPAGHACVLVEKVDYASFKLFLLSILWRASVSSRPEFHDVQLGPDEERVRRMLLERSPGTRCEFPCIIFLYKQPGVIVQPIRQQLDGHLMYHFILTTVHIWFLVPGHASQERIVNTGLKEDGSFIAIVMDPQETQLLRSICEVERETRHSSGVLRRVGEK